MPNARARIVTREPMRPRPMMPRVLPLSSMPMKLRTIPLPALHARMRLGDVAAEREQHGHRVLGGRHDVGGRRVDDKNPARGAGIDVDVVETDAGATDDAQPRAGVHELLRHRGAAARDQRVGFTNCGEQLFAFEAGTVIEVDVVRCVEGCRGRSRRESR